MTRWKKERLAEQLKFFGAKKTKFISVYAKKPRILCKDESKQAVSAPGAARQAQLSWLYQAQVNRGIERGLLGFNQMAQAQMAMSQQSQAIPLGQSVLCSGFNQGLMHMGRDGAIRQ